MLFAVSISLVITVRQMNAAARATNESYRQYISFVEIYNEENRTKQMEREGSPNIRRAIAHYSGINLNEIDELPETPQEPQNTAQSLTGEPTLENDVRPTSEQGAYQPNRNGTPHHQENAERVVEDFMNDTTDQDLTA
jgi:hypothetical protein